MPKRPPVKNLILWNENKKGALASKRNMVYPTVQYFLQANKDISQIQTINLCEDLEYIRDIVRL
jgi:hypothetical protein